MTLDLVIEQRSSSDQPWSRDFDVDEKDAEGSASDAKQNAPKVLLQAIKFNPKKSVGEEPFDAAVQFAVVGPPTSVRALRKVNSGD